MQNQFDLTEDQLAIQDMARKFTADAITPFAAEWDEKCHYPRRCLESGGRAWFWRDLRVRRIGRHWPWAAGGGVDHGGDGLWLPRDQRLYLDPQYGGVDDRLFRRRGGEGAVSARPGRHGEDRQLLPDRAGSAGPMRRR